MMGAWARKTGLEAGKQEMLQYYSSAKAAIVCSDIIETSFFSNDKMHV
jgi:hypothetical protein